MDANVCYMLIGLLWDTIIIEKKARNGFCYFRKYARNGYSYYWNTVDVNVTDVLIG